MQESSRIPQAGQSSDAVLSDDMLRYILANPVLSLKHLASIAPTCKLKVFREAYHARCAAEESWAEEAATRAFGSPLINLLISYVLAPQDDGWAYEDHRETVELDLDPGVAYPDAASLQSCETQILFEIRAPVSRSRWEVPGTGRWSFALHRSDHYRTIASSGVLRAYLSKGGRRLSIDLLIAVGDLSDYIGLMILLVKAMHAGQTTGGLNEGRAPCVHVGFWPVCDPLAQAFSLPEA